MSKMATMLAAACALLPACGEAVDEQSATVASVQEGLAPLSYQQGTFTQIATQCTDRVGNPCFPNSQPGGVALLTDGRILMSGPDGSTNWFTLTPDDQGSYVNGTWAQVGSSTQVKLFFPSFILRDGRFLECGGEYTSGRDVSAECEIFDPVSNSWAVTTPMPELINDTPAAELPDGEVLVLACNSADSYRYTEAADASWSVAAPSNRSKINNESGSLLLQDGSVLVGAAGFDRYLPSTNQWVATAATPRSGSGCLAGNCTTANEFLSTVANTGNEIGAFMLLHDGRALVLGANSHNGLYTAPSSQNPQGAGSWTLASDTQSLDLGLQPNGTHTFQSLNHGDAPAVVEPNGRVLSVVTSDQTGIGSAAAIFEEFDPYTNDFVAGTSAWYWPVGPSWAQSNFPNAERVHMLALPNSNNQSGMGQIFVIGGLGTAWVYTPSTDIVPNLTWRPTISSISPPAFGAFQLFGMQLNGLTTGGDFGDDGKAATNYPIVSLKNSVGQIQFVRSFDFDQMAPRPNSPGFFSFAVPASFTEGAYTISVTANGVGSANTATLNVTKDRGFGLVPVLFSL